MKLPRGIGWEDPKRKVMREVSPWHKMAWRSVSRQWSGIVSIVKERTGNGRPAGSIRSGRMETYNCVPEEDTTPLLWHWASSARRGGSDGHASVP